MYPLPPPWPRKVSVSPPPPTSSTWRQTSHSASSPVRSFTYLHITLIFTLICTHICTHIYTYIYTNIYTNLHSYLQIFTLISKLIFTHNYTHIYTYLHSYLHISTLISRPTGCGRPRTTCPRCRRWRRCRAPGRRGWGRGQPGAGARGGAQSWSTRCWQLLGLISILSFLYLLQKKTIHLPVHECRLDNLENGNAK